MKKLAFLFLTAFSLGLAKEVKTFDTCLEHHLASDEEGSDKRTKIQKCFNFDDSENIVEVEADGVIPDDVYELEGLIEGVDYEIIAEVADEELKLYRLLNPNEKKSKKKKSLLLNLGGNK